MKKLFALLLLSITSNALANLPYYPLQFPRDEGAHVKNIPYAYQHLIEWWYFNGLIKTREDFCI